METFDDESNAVYSPLKLSILSEDESMVKGLIDLGVDLNKKDMNGKTPLYTACTCAHPKMSIIKLLIEHGADLSKEEENGNTSLYETLKKKNYVDVLNYLNDIIDRRDKNN